MKAKIGVNQIFEIEITDLTDKGEGIGHLEGLAVFVDGAVIGDLARIKITQSKKNYAKAIVTEISRESKIRIKPPCEHFDECGGCQIQNIDYQEQLKIKKQVVIDALERIGNQKNVNVFDTIGMDNPYHYRNKSSLPLNVKQELGFYQKRSHDIVQIKNCLIQREAINEVMNFIQEWIIENQISCYDESRHKGLLRHIVIRESRDNGDLMVIAVVNKKKKEPFVDKLAADLFTRFPKVVSVFQNLNYAKGNRILAYDNVHIKGEKEIRDTIGTFTFKISPNSFFQVNNTQTEKLYETALDYADLQGHEIVFDLYSGIGTITQLLSLKAKQVYGIEIVGAAIDNADENKVLNNIENITYINGNAEDETEDLIKRRILPDIIVVDPPRKGLETKLIDKIIDVKPKKIVYVSCKPSTLARDISIFTQHGYTIDKVQPVDMFPHTMHVETVALLGRK